jgi:hypothetical protein
MAKQEKAIKTKRGLPMGAKAAVALGAMGMGAALFGAGCENETNSTPEPKVCDCTNKIYGNAPCDCGGEDCTCEQKEWPLLYGMVLDNQTGIPLPDGFISNINTFLEVFRSAPGEEAVMDDIIDNHNIKIIIVPNTAFSRNGDELTIGIDSADVNADIYSLFYEVIAINNINDRKK